MHIHFLRAPAREFDEAVRMVLHSADELRLDYSHSTEPGKGLNIVIGPNWRFERRLPSPIGAVHFTLEQHAPNSHWVTPWQLDGLRRSTCWSYDPVAQERLAALNVPSTLVQIGYSPSWETIPKTEEDIDVAFVGGADDYRRSVLQSCERAGLRTAWPSAFGAERDKVYARAKVCLSLASWKPPIMQSLRIGYLAANRKCVVSDLVERPDLYPYGTSVDMVPPDKIAERCRQLVDDATARKTSAERLYEAFRAFPFTANLATAVERICQPVDGASAVERMKSGRDWQFRVRMDRGNLPIALVQHLAHHRNWKIRPDGDGHALIYRIG